MSNFVHEVFGDAQTHNRRAIGTSSYRREGIKNKYEFEIRDSITITTHDARRTNKEPIGDRVPGSEHQSACQDPV